MVRPTVRNVFVSHSSQDREFVENEVMPLLTSHGCEVFYSPDSIMPAEQWERTILKGLKECDAFLLVMSPQSAQSPWVKLEVDWIFHKGGRTIIPVLLEQCEADDFHIGLVSIQHVDFVRDRLGGRQHLLKTLGKRAVPQVPSVREAPVIAIPKPVDIITNSIGMKLKLIPAGGFLMGSPESDEMASADEKPQHHVEITKPFHLGVYTVTQAEYERVMGTNPSHFKNNRNPVETVTWFDAVAFCNKLSEHENLKPFYQTSGGNVSIVGGNGYRLPTEAEWEYACRAEKTTRWCFGDNESQLAEYGWFDQNSGGTTHPLGEKSANPWGLCDMNGNVWEWCWDWYGDYKASPANDPSGPKQGEYRVLRGGSFVSPSSSVRSAYRGSTVPTNRLNTFGFRLART